MGLWTRLRGKKEKAYPVDQAAALFQTLLRQKGFSMEAPDLSLAWRTFQTFCREYRFQCDDDAVLWEIGPYGRTARGEKVFQWHLVRQMSQAPGEDEDMQQLCFDLDFPAGVGERLRAAVWSYDYDGDLAAFFSAVEARADFSLPAGVRPTAASVRLDRV